MLEKLKVSNISVLGDIEVAFSNGLNIASGETGAGKSLIFNTLVFFSNKKFPKELIKDKKSNTSIKINLQIKSEKIKEILSKNGLATENNNSIEMLRVITPDATSKYYIDKTRVKLELVTNIFENYFSFFMQGAQSLLLDKKNQINILDKFLKMENDLSVYEISYLEYQECEKNYQKLKKQKNEIEEQRDFLTFQLSELEKIKIEDANEEHNYIEEVQIQKSLNENKESVLELIALIDNEGMGLIKAIETKITKLKLNDENINKLSSNLSFHINELSYQVSVLNSAENIDELFDQKQDQLFLLKDLRRKYKLTTDELIEKRNYIKELFENESSIDINLKMIEKNRDSLKQICLDKAYLISDKRKKGSNLLSKKIKEGLLNLGILNSNWIVSFRDIEMNNKGIDDIEFLFSANPDFPPESLRSVASGGELSRIMLTLSLEISKIFESKVILFDEPDVGLGGAVAEKLGEKISQLSQTSQVLCISHLPQVASFADTHLLISKKNNHGKTTISISNLSKTDRIKEIARMLSGKKIENEAIVLARKMIK
jgi:DNA repair protein RecN (Recombination protein N)